MLLTAMTLVLASVSAGTAQGVPPPDDGQTFDLAEATRCSDQLRVEGRLVGEARRRCMIAVASTYIELEQNRLPPEQMLLTDDIARYHLGNAPEFRAGNRARVMAEQAHKVISAIRNRQWTVDGDTVWIVYDGYLKAKPDSPGFHVAERFMIVGGLIREIMVAGVKAPGAKAGSIE